MSSIDKRVVEMEFDNKQFERGVKDTLASLEALKEGLKLEGATKGLQDVGAAGKDLNLSNIAEGVNHISDRFGALGAIGFTVIQNLTTAAMNFAQRMGGLVLDPLVSGGKSRALNIQQAKFMFRGLGMNIEQAMADALFAVKGTAFGLDEAARAASQLGASQVELGDDMKGALRGISGVAAMTNSSYSDTARIFTRVAGQGRVMAVDLNSIAARGLNAAAVLAESFGKTEAEIREMVTKGEISFDMFSKAMDEAFGENATKANETYTGSLANMRAALSRIGASFFTPFLLQQRDLFNALTPAIDDVSAALEPLITAMSKFTGKQTANFISFIESIDFTKLELIVGPLLNILNLLGRAALSIINPMREAFRQIFPPMTMENLREILMSFKSFLQRIKMGEESTDKLRRTFAGLFAVFSIGWTVVKEVAKFLGTIFDMVFSGSAGFLDATSSIGDFFVALDLAIKNGEGLAKFFKGLTEVLQGPIRFIKRLASALFSLFEFDPPSSGQFTEAFEPLGRLGEILINIWDRVVASWKRVGDAFKPLIGFLEKIFGGAIDNIMEMFSDLDFDKIMDILNTGLFASLLAVFKSFSDNLGTGMGSAIHKLTTPFAKLTWTLNTMQTTLRVMTLMQLAIAIGILAASVVALSKVDSVGLTKALTAMSVMMGQLILSMKGISLVGGVKGIIGIGAGLVLFAIAIRVLASAVKALADLSWQELAKGLVGVTVLIGALVVAVKGMSGQTANMISAGAGLLLLAFGIKVLVGSVTDLSGLSWEEMAKGIAGVGALLASLAIFTKLVSVNKAGLAQGVGLVLLATAIKILASAAIDFASLNWEEIGKGLGSIGAILLAFTIFSKTINPAGLVKAGISLVLIGASMKILASAMKDFADMSWEEIGKGLASMAGALTLIVLALNLMPPSTLASAAALVAVSFALGLIADAMEQMGGMSWEEIGKGLVTLAGSLAIIALAMLAMTSALPGAAATLLVAVALRTLLPVLKTFGNMSIGQIAKSLGTLAGVFVIIGLAGLVLGPVIPVLIGLGVAVGLLGIGLLSAGAGIMLFSAGLTALAAAGAAGTAALVAIVMGLVGLIPKIAETLGLALVIFIEIVANAGPQMLDAMTAVLQAVIGAIEDNSPDIIEMIGDMALNLVEKLTEIIPKMAEAALEMMLAVLKEMNENIPPIVSAIISLIVAILEEMADGVPDMVIAATDLMVAFLTSIANNLGDVLDAGADIIIELIEGIGENMLKITEAAMDTIIVFVDGLATAIDEKSEELREAGGRLAMAIIDGMTGGLASSIGDVVSSAREVASNAYNSAKEWLDSRSPSKKFHELGIFSGEGLANGLMKSSPLIKHAAQDVGEDAISTMKKSISEMADVLNMDEDMSPVIRPVLDLSEIRKDASQIKSFMPNQRIMVDAAFSKAKYASLGYYNNKREEHVDTTPEASRTEMTYNQYNQSPKALSSADIYRQTKNQLSKTKGALTPNASQST